MIAVALTVALSTTALSGCNSPDGASGNGQAATGGATAKADRAQQDDVKQSGYVSAFNALAQNDFLAQKLEAYASYRIPTATPANTLDMTFTTDSLVRIVEDLKKARAEPGTERTAPLDKAVDALIPPLEEIVRIERELAPYYSARAYRDDNLARGKAADGPLKSAHANALSAFTRLGDALSVYQRSRNTQRIADLNAAGHVAEASLLRAMAAAETMIAAYTKGDMDAAARQSQVVGTALDQMRANESKIQKIAGNEHSYRNVIERLTEMQGLFSDYRNGDRTARDRVLTHYNLAVGQSNAYRFPD
ncbi:DUF3829 domain-containing protein [Sphingomonas sp. 2R-10]|uniref:DUF3829 domain-containing protein n=1 Tax=Sphingomonas sp. 2R-10 TaxID=3045148 RepID=UPI0013DE53E3|nr:DUF3829 domain-containing protein [Sphingomonas sp. 2R-10]MDJ0278665.1 DUF3829 domain-containing protein [Sphingomonas sp. 2R-10]